MNNIFVVGLSRSGTTLLTTILDSHPDISMGYELIPAKLGSLKKLAQTIEATLRDGATSAREVAKALPAAMDPACGVFIKRATRAMVPPKLLVEVLEDFSNTHTDHPRSIWARTALAGAIVACKQGIEGTKNAGFKVPITLVKELKKDAQNTIVIAVIRDPRDTYASQVSRNMTTSPNSFARQWNGFASQIQTFRQRNFIDLIIRYEDITTRLDETLEAIQHTLGLPTIDGMRDFYASKASVHAPGQKHVNAEALSQDVFDSSIDRWKNDISEADAILIEQVCKQNMRVLEYATNDAIKGRMLQGQNVFYRLTSIAKRLVR